jgi:hypothetical protein
MALELFQPDDNGQSSRGELSELMIKISPSRQLSGGEGNGHLSRHTIKTGFEVAFAFESDDLLGNLALAENQQCGDRADAVFGGKALVIVNVHFADADAAVVLVGQFIKDRRDHFAGTAPFRPEINQDGDRRLQNFRGEVLLRESNDVG